MNEVFWFKFGDKLKQNIPFAVLKMFSKSTHTHTGHIHPLCTIYVIVLHLTNPLHVKTKTTKGKKTKINKNISCLEPSLLYLRLHASGCHCHSKKSDCHPLGRKFNNIRCVHINVHAIWARGGVNLSALCF